MTSLKFLINQKYKKGEKQLNSKKKQDEKETKAQLNEFYVLEWWQSK